MLKPSSVSGAAGTSARVFGPDGESTVFMASRF
jgi:hypothetical protein